MVFTNNSLRTPKDLSHRLKKIGLQVGADHIYTSALATARFLNSQRPKGTAFVIGESGLMEALHDVGYVVTDLQPDYVVVGDTDFYDHPRITQAVRLVHNGARLIATNPDVTGPAGQDRPRHRGAGRVDREGDRTSSLLRRKAESADDADRASPDREHSENAVMVGDRMDTDVVAGIESGLRRFSS